MSDVQVISEDILIFTSKSKIIGSGAFGTVFEGTYKRQPCAVKVLNHLATCFRTKLPTGGQEFASKAFERECMVLESFEHPNVLWHLETTKHPDSDISILVTELLDCNLSNYIEMYESCLTNKCEISIAKDLASGLAYIHSREIMHRDLCGVNVLMKLNNPFPIAKIADFGMSKTLDPTKLNSTIGHRTGYLPLESFQEGEKHYDLSLDVFSYGVIMMQIIFRKKNVESGRDRMSLLTAIRDGTHTLKPVIIACLEEDKRNRPSATHLCTFMHAITQLKMGCKKIQPHRPGLWDTRRFSTHF